MRKNSIIIGLIIVTLTGVVFMKGQAAEETIPIHVYNDFYSEKTRLVGVVAYKYDKPDAEFKLILECVDEESNRTITDLTVPKGLVKSIHLILTNYHEVPNHKDDRETLIASLVFTPIPSSVLDITFAIKGRAIVVHDAKYHLPPPFNGSDSVIVF
jgi:hypothetical protein